MIVIIGASGGAGIPTVKELVKRGHDVRALTSSEASEQNLKSLGVAETVRGDFRSDADVKRALAGAQQVVQIPPRFKPDEFEIGRRCVDAARAAGVSHYLFLSAFHPQLQKLPHHWSKLLVEEYLIESHVPFTIVQPAMFMQNIRVEWPRIVKNSVYARPYSPARNMSVVDTRDMAEAMVNILERPELRGAIYELCGPGPITHNEMAAMISDAVFCLDEAVQRPLDDWQTWARGRGHYDEHGFPGGTTVVLEALLGRKPRGFAQFIGDFVAEQAASGAA
jgi:uncharacterized protein YbjT (DUF2867 family)